jgi:Kdo2-lipid IVA lauroyltransferase/acyltransferase
MRRRRKRWLFLRKYLEGYLVYYPFRLFILWAKHVSAESIRFYGEKFATVAFFLFRRGRKIALNNLRLALGSEKSEGEIEQICLNNFKNIGRNMMETLYTSNQEDGYSRRLVRIEGEEYLDQALKQGKGVIALSGHVGNFSLMCVRLANEGYPISAVARISKNAKVLEPITSYMESVGMEYIPSKPQLTCVSRCLNALKRNRILFVQIDLNAPTTEAWVDFFGYLVPTFKGSVVLSLRTGAPILPMFIIRNPDNLHKIIIHPPFGLSATGNIEQDITSNIARLTKIAEAMIRDYPEQWWWAMPRFKRARDIRTGESLSAKRS